MIGRHHFSPASAYLAILGIGYLNQTLPQGIKVHNTFGVSRAGEPWRAWPMENRASKPFGAVTPSSSICSKGLNWPRKHRRYNAFSDFCLRDSSGEGLGVGFRGVAHAADPRATPKLEGLPFQKGFTSVNKRYVADPELRLNTPINLGPMPTKLLASIQ